MPVEAPRHEPESWNRFNVFTIKLASDGTTWRGIGSHTSNDLRIDFERIAGGKKETGTLLVIGGQKLAVSGLELPAGSEIDALDTPALFLQMIVGGLAVALPGGPSGPKGRVSINHLEKTASLDSSTPSASGSIPAPWTMKGQIERGPTGTIDFDLELSGTKASDPRQPGGLHWSGSLESSPTEPSIGDAMSLQGWDVYTLGPRSIQRGGSTTVDYGAWKDERTYQTVGELRSALVEESKPPGRPDPARDFTGFWKESCERTFGLRFERSAPGAPYSIVFCGPGGCGDVESGRRSYINGDERFQVIDPNQIKELSGTKWETYRRCSAGDRPNKK